jgi:ribose-phosphate pyrophosphokinase
MPVIVLGPDDHFRQRDIGPAGHVIRAERRLFPDREQLTSLAGDDAATLDDQDVLIVQTTSGSREIQFFSLLQLIDVARHHGARNVACFVPYLCFQRQDRRTSVGEPDSAGLVLRAMEAAGCDLTLTVDRHSMRPHAQRMPIVNIAAAPHFFGGHPRWADGIDTVVAADQGGAGRAEEVAKLLGLDTVVLAKTKSAEYGTTYHQVPPVLAGRHCLVVEDLCSSGSTLRPVQDVLRSVGALSMSVFVSHLVAGREVLLQRLGDEVRIATTDSCGDAASEVRVLPLALAEWRRHLAEQR